jgi:DNA-binding NarL/FixJ family response regulator
MDEYNVLLVEDDPIWSEGITEFLHREPDIRVSGVLGSKEEAIAYMHRNEVDIVVVDIGLNGDLYEGIEAAAEICRMKRTRLIMLTSHNESELIYEAFRAGAVNYLTKEHYTALPEAIRNACSGRTGIHSCSAEILRAEFVRLKREERSAFLTNMEKEILQLVAEGRTQTQIETILHIAERTIKNHVNRILKKFKVKTAKEAAMIAKRKDLL